MKVVGLIRRSDLIIDVSLTPYFASEKYENFNFKTCSKSTYKISKNAKNY